MGGKGRDQREVMVAIEEGQYDRAVDMHHYHAKEEGHEDGSSDRKPCTRERRFHQIRWDFLVKINGLRRPKKKAVRGQSIDESESR